MSEARATGGDPLLSVVVTIVEGGDAVRRFLEALTTQRDAPPLEILVPFDDTVAEAHALARDIPGVTWLPLGRVATAAPASSAAGQHELFDRRRAAALGVARGELIAILEDRGIPRPDWARTAVRLHELPHAVIGGAIEPAPARLVDWVLHVCDYSRYALPFAPGVVDWVSDVNVVYKRGVLDRTRELWRERFHEPLVHWQLQRDGETLYLAPELVVDHHRVPRPMGRLVAERFGWGRLFGAIRARAVSPARRVLLSLAAPLIPPVLLVRHARVRFRRGEAGRFILALPVLLLFLAAWTAGEAWGQLTARAASR